MPQDPIDAAIASFQHRQSAAYDSLPASEKERLVEADRAAAAARQKLAKISNIEYTIVQGVSAVNAKSAGRIPIIALVATNFEYQSGMPMGFDLGFHSEGSVSKSQPLGYLQFRFVVDGEICAYTRGPGPHDPMNIPPEFSFGTAETANLTSEWVEDMIAKWLSQ